MKISIFIISIFLIGLTINLVSYANPSKITPYSVASNTNTEGEFLFKKKCSACHITTRPEDMSKLLAPPIMGVMKHIKGGVEGDTDNEKRENAINFIVDYARNPAVKKSMLEPMAIDRVGLMPSQKLSVTRKELILIANYLYDNFSSKGNQKDCGNACGGNCKH